MERIAIFPGSFDPFTRGHAAIVEQALLLFDKVVIGVGNNSLKCGFLPVESRFALVEELYRDEERVEVLSYSGLTSEFAKQVGATALIRGVRNVHDFEYERSIESVNRRLNPDLITVVLLSPTSVADISSSIIRELFNFGADVSELMPEGVDINRYMTWN
ncbi:MAG: pantetheine-phosphate adenylyltransferase [Rikenellaceae bacterium]